MLTAGATALGHIYNIHTHIHTRKALPSYRGSSACTHRKKKIQRNAYKKKNAYVHTQSTAYRRTYMYTMLFKTIYRGSTACTHRKKNAEERTHNKKTHMYTKNAYVHTQSTAYLNRRTYIYTYALKDDIQRKHCLHTHKKKIQRNAQTKQKNTHMYTRISVPT